VGSANVKSVLNKVKEESIQHLKKNFLGDAKVMEAFEIKLKTEIKT
jgi:hypothetical protein